MDRWTRYLAAIVVALVIGTSAALPSVAQDAGDQIVETDVTPAADDSDGETAADETPAADATDAADDANSAQTDATADPATDREAETDADVVDETRAATETTSDASDASDGGPGASLIVVEDLNLREEADVEADVIQVMPAGSVVTLAGDGEAVNDFLPVEFGEDAGWAFLPFLVEEAQGDNLAVVTTELNLRAGPSVADDVITVMPEGAQVRVAGLATDDEGDDWNRVYYEETLAWALAEYVEYTDAPADTSDATAAAETAGAGETAAAAPAAVGDLVTVLDANLRAGASIEDSVVSVVPFGTFASVTGEAANGFVPVSVGGVAGWLSTEVIAPAEIAASLTGAIAADESSAATGEVAVVSGTPDDDEPRTALSDLNLRAEPGENAEILILVPVGETVTLTFDGYENGYAAVSYQGVAGWVVADLLQP